MIRCNPIKGGVIRYLSLILLLLLSLIVKLFFFLLLDVLLCSVKLSNLLSCLDSGGEKKKMLWLLVINAFAHAAWLCSIVSLRCTTGGTTSCMKKNSKKTPRVDSQCENKHLQVGSQQNIF